jgi:putative nucleotidyltransferase with HDIG domain
MSAFSRQPGNSEKAYALKGDGVKFGLVLRVCSEVRAGWLASSGGKKMNREAPTKSWSGCVLVVDDERASREVLSAILRDCGIACRTACDGKEALRILDVEPISAVLSDLEMPGMSGFELLTRVRAKYPAVAFLVVTGMDDVRVGIEAMREGAEDYLVKPLQLEVVSASLERALGKKRIELELEGYKKHLEEMVHERTVQLEFALLQLERTYRETLRALGNAVDLRDSPTAGHSHRVVLYSLKIAGTLSLNRENCQTIAVGAWLHDIGKLAIPDSVLLKPGSLTDAEWRVMRSHVEIGYELVRQIPFLQHAAEMIRTHHERSDGSGYPRGLKGQEIPVGARIFAVADTLDAMTSDRPYRLARPFQEAFDEIRSGAGRRYDERAAEAFLAFPIETWEAIRLENEAALGSTVIAQVFS